jgi:hypothetical protein
MAILEWRLMGAHDLSTAFTVDAGYKAFPISTFLLSEAQYVNSAANDQKSRLE